MSIIDEIPPEAEITIHLRNGKSFRGFEATRAESREAGLLRLEREPSRGQWHAIIILVSEIAAFEIEWES